MMKRTLCVLLAAAMLSGCAARALPEIEHQSDAQPKNSASDERKPDESEPDESEPDESKSDESKADESKADESKADESKPDESKPDESKPDESKADESKTAASGDESGGEAADWMLLLANATHAIGDYEPKLAEIQNGYKMDTRVADAAKKMIADAKAQGVSLLVCSAYRPIASQKRNFDAHLAANIAAGMTKEQALASTRSLIAEPGKSEHQTGLAADIVTPTYQNLDDGYAKTDAAKWLLANAADYGFILRYPKDKTELTGISFEPWHYRFVGEKAAKTIMEKGICLEEFLAAGVA